MARSRPALLLLLGTILAVAPPLRAQDKGGDPAPPPAGGSAKPANDPKAPLPLRVNQAIDAGVRWLLDRDKKPAPLLFVKGNWNDEITGNAVYEKTGTENTFCHPTGCTSLALYALLKSGVSKDDPVVKKAFQWLKTGKSNAVVHGDDMQPNEVPSGTYEISALVLALEARANPHKREAERERDLKFKLKKGEKLDTSVKLDAEDQAWMKKLIDALVKRQSRGQGWRYALVQGDGIIYNGIRGDNDLSATQLALLALLAGERCGFKQNDQLYVDALQFTLSLQEKEGPEVARFDPSMKKDDARYAPQKDHARGFSYLGAKGNAEERKATSSMTCCGLANIVICTSILEARDSKLLTPVLQAQAETGWWDGVAWMDFHWSVTANVNKANYNYHYYYLYCMERACDLKRVNLLGGHPWYNEGAKVLVDNQTPTGAWVVKDTHNPCDVLNTCFALLFLNRATPAITAGD